MITKEQLSELRRVAEAATPGPYQGGYVRQDDSDEPMTNEQFIDWQKDAVRLGTRDRIFIVTAPRNPAIHDSPPKESWEHDCVTVSVTGNGPTSEANAVFFSQVTPSNIISLCDEIERLQELVTPA